MTSPIEYLKGVGPQRAELLKKELGIFTFGDLLDHFPYRHIDKTKVDLISSINPQTEYIQVVAVLVHYEIVGVKAGRRLVAQVKDKSGFLELTWFQGISWIQKMLEPGKSYLIYGRAGFYLNKPQIIHPEMEELTAMRQDGKNFLEPVYPLVKACSSGVPGLYLFGFL